MSKANLTKEQNLCGVRLFLNLFNLRLVTVKDPKDGVTYYEIHDENDQYVGVITQYADKFSINANTAYGTLHANFPFGEVFGFEDKDCGGCYVEWKHNIDFQIYGEKRGDKDYKGTILMDVSMDSDFGKKCRLHTTLNYKDFDGKDVEIKMMNGNVFNYESFYESPTLRFREVITVDPWNDMDPFLLHRTTTGKYNRDMMRYPKEIRSFIWHNGDEDREHLRGYHYESNMFRPVEYHQELRDRVGDDASIQSTIQKGLFMQAIDPSFAKRMEYIIQSFKAGDVSFLENLMDATFSTISEEERQALFGTSISRMRYHNGADNILDAYFGQTTETQFKPGEVYQKTMNQEKGEETNES